MLLRRCFLLCTKGAAVPDLPSWLTERAAKKYNEDVTPFASSRRLLNIHDERARFRELISHLNNRLRPKLLCSRFAAMGDVRLVIDRVLIIVMAFAVVALVLLIHSQAIGQFDNVLKAILRHPKDHPEPVRLRVIVPTAMAAALVALSLVLAFLTR